MNNLVNSTTIRLYSVYNIWLHFIAIQGEDTTYMIANVSC